MTTLKQRNASLFASRWAKRWGFDWNIRFPACRIILYYIIICIKIINRSKRHF